MEEILIKIITLIPNAFTSYIFRGLSLFEYKKIEVFETTSKKIMVPDEIWKKRMKETRQTVRTGKKKIVTISVGMYLHYKTINLSHILTEPMDDYRFDQIVSFYASNVLRK